MAKVISHTQVKKGNKVFWQASFAPDAKGSSIFDHAAQIQIDAGYNPAGYGGPWVYGVKTTRFNTNTVVADVSWWCHASCD